MEVVEIWFVVHHKHFLTYFLCYSLKFIVFGGIFLNMQISLILTVINLKHLANFNKSLLVWSLIGPIAKLYKSVLSFI